MHVLRRNKVDTFRLLDREGEQISMGRHREGHIQLDILRKRRVFSMTPADATAAAAWLLRECNPELLTPALLKALGETPVIVG